MKKEPKIRKFYYFVELSDLEVPVEVSVSIIEAKKLITIEDPEKYGSVKEYFEEIEGPSPIVFIDLISWKVDAGYNAFTVDVEEFFKKEGSKKLVLDWYLENEHE
jgi:hypothetical protein